MYTLNAYIVQTSHHRTVRGCAWLLKLTVLGERYEWSGASPAPPPPAAAPSTAAPSLLPAPQA
eukprot:1161590-Pelagomonas_calceolata.AAC.14